MENFYYTGVNIMNNVAVARGSENSSFRLSLTRLNSDGIIPATTLDRDNINFIGQRTLGDLTVEAKANYVIEETSFRPQLSDKPSNPALSLTFMPTTLDVRLLQRRDSLTQLFNFFDCPTGLLSFTPLESNRGLIFFVKQFNVTKGIIPAA